ncbi:hypothetical protein HELRODRAFT_72599, partial [Helobdella robusta]|uniref:NAD-dependent epimerase/dehydratase domain-containing protein n=1 Tax=Helobdella robusta TaxID=6412 RepID=T1G124_HELRO
TSEVLVTGASGYLASHVVKILLQDGYSVRGTVRSLKNPQKVEPLRDIERACPGCQPLDLVEADLLNAESINRAVESCEYVIHVASPFPVAEPKSESELVKPAVEGTMSVLQACRRHGVRRLVLTSSIVSVIGDFATFPANKVVTEECWGSPDVKDAYFKSKILAEKTAWDFVNNLHDTDKFELAVINPGLIQGPPLCGGDATSFEKMLEREMPILPKFNVCVCDVRDVALAHVRALTVPEAAGHRHIISTGSYWLRDLAIILREEFYKYGYNVPTTNSPNFLMWMASFFDKVVSRLLPMLDKYMDVNNDRMVKVLGVKPTPIKQTMVEMGHALIQKGFIRKTSKYDPRPQSKL